MSTARGMLCGDLLNVRIMPRIDRCSTGARRGLNGVRKQRGDRELTMTNENSLYLPALPFAVFA